MIELYLWDSCPFCRKVSMAVAELGLVESEDFQVIPAGPGTPGHLIVKERGGSQMVPFLIDGETAMYESDDIIAYLKSWSRGKKRDS
ncbi:MAG: glutathione S-transferase N-terminal domain-containing protein [Desulfocapsaceae bacterium]|nr:glutathione S-transferase N-terminal domain-containing protein [Desulfocapsaceae bacterium]